jgi:hypothetical protein
MMKEPLNVVRFRRALGKLSMCVSMGWCEFIGSTALSMAI